MVRSFLALLVVFAGYLVFEYGRISAGYDVVDAASERGELEAHIKSLDDEIEALKQEVALLETHRDIDREAYREVEGSLITLQAKIQEQRDAIAFYRGIVSPADGNSGLTRAGSQADARRQGARVQHATGAGTGHEARSQGFGRRRREHRGQ